jgi:hypothetical protein
MIKMNKNFTNKIRWAVYRLLVKKRKLLRPRRGGYSVDFLCQYINSKWPFGGDCLAEPIESLIEFINLEEALQ